MGKSIEMLLYAAKNMRHPRTGNPTLVFLTDRNDLDDQLFAEVFAPAEILPEKPVQADSRADLRTLLRRTSGGIVFTTLQKFAPDGRGDVNAVLTDRRNVIVVADEAHRSQWGLRTTPRSCRYAKRPKPASPPRTSPAQRNAITLADRVATVRFVKRDTSRLDAERMSTELGPTLVTTPEQTVLDLARRPDLGDAADEVRDAVRILIGRADDGLLDELAAAQRARASILSGSSPMAG